MENAMAAKPGFACVLTLTVALASSAARTEDLAQYSGAQLFQRFCASCHGLRGEGNGPVAPFFKLMPPDLTRLARRNKGDFPADKIYSIIDGRSYILPHGSREMPIWGLQFAAAEDNFEKQEAQTTLIISKLVEYLRSIQTK
jgi:mono/diheme cytochrome c family protein